MQMVVMFLICGSSVLSAVACTVLCLAVVVDAEARIRTDKIDGRPHAVWRASNAVIRTIADGLRSAWNGMASWRNRHTDDDVVEESERLLG